MNTTNANKYLLISSGGQTFAIAAEHVGEIVAMTPLTPLPHSQPWLRGVLNRRGRVLPVIDLHARLHASATLTPLTNRCCVMVLHLGHDAAAGALVDRVIDVIAVAPAQMQDLPDSAQTPWTSQAFQLADSIAFRLVPDARLLGDVIPHSLQAA